MSGTRSKGAELLDAARRPEDGAMAKADLCEQAVREADALGDLELAYDARLELLDAACWAGDPRRMSVTLAWCLAHHDRTPTATDLFDVLWRYKWVALEMPQFVEVDRVRIERLLEDMDDRVRRAGYSPRPVFMHRVEAAMRLGDVAAATRYEAEFLASPRDALADCAACERHHRVMHALWSGHDDEALTLAAPLIDGRSGCAEVPASTLGHLLVPLLRRGEIDRAVELHRTGERLVLRRARHLAETFSQHLVFLVLTGNHTRALERVEKYHDAAQALPSAHARLGLALALHLLARALSARGTRSVRLSLGASPDESHDTEALAARSLESAQKIATELDSRNGNGHFGARVRAALETERLAIERPLTKRA